MKGASKTSSTPNGVFDQLVNHFRPSVFVDFSRALPFDAYTRA